MTTKTKTKPVAENFNLEEILKMIRHIEQIVKGGGLANSEELARLVDGMSRNETKVSEHEAIGMWANRKDMSDPVAYVREMRKGRGEG